jgi:hypothetical protein
MGLEGEGQLLLALGHRRRVGVAGDVEGDKVFPGPAISRGELTPSRQTAPEAGS